jgi:hypothetical protein
MSTSFVAPAPAVVAAGDLVILHEVRTLSVWVCCGG